ncbi:MAG: VapE domain-containing protein, partial [Cellulosilyticaceae bacterium]
MENIDLSKIDFNEDRTYGFLKISDKEEQKKKKRLLLKEAKKRGQEELFKSKIEELRPSTRPHAMYEVSNKGTPLKIWENLKALYDSRGIELKRNELKRSIESNHTWYVYEDFLTEINSHCKRSGLSLSKDELWGFTSYIANKSAYNPVMTYLEYAHEKYKRNRNPESELGKLLKTITYSKDCDKKDIAFNEAMLLMWLITGVKMGLNDGTQNSEFAIVFKGAQGLGKTRWVRSLMPKEHLVDFFKDGVQLDLSNKDDIMQSTAYWLCELGELGGTMKKSDRDALKAWITSPSDEFRTPYSRKAEKYPRRSFFACTVNDDQFLRDD